MLEQLKKLWKDEEGAAAVEYGVLVAGIIALSIALIYGIGQYVRDGFATVDSELGNNTPGDPADTTYGN